jgi:hypothetical protein
MKTFEVIHEVEWYQRIDLDRNDRLCSESTGVHHLEGNR